MNRIFHLLLVILLLVAVAPVAAQDGEDDEILVVTVGTDATYPPFEVLEDGEFVGFDIDLLLAIAEDAGFEVEFVNAGFDTIFFALSEGEFDVVISASTITEEREEIIDFSDPYFNAGQSIAVQSALAEEISGPDDLAGLRIGVQLGTTGAEYAEGVEGAEVISFDDINVAFQALGQGDVDAVINDGPTSADIIANNPDLDAVIVGEPLTDEFYGIAVNPELPELLDTINLSLGNVIADGTYAEIYNVWFGSDPPAAFMPGGADEFMVDFTDPASVTLGLLNAILGGTVDEIVAFACEGLAAGDSTLFPTEEDLAAFEGIVLGDTSALELTVDEADGVATVTAAGNITLEIGGAPTELPASLALDQLGVDSIRLTQNDDGEWRICPEVE